MSTLAKNEKTWVLRLCPSKLCFVISERGPVGGANIWCELSQVCVLPLVLIHLFPTLPHWDYEGGGKGRRGGGKERRGGPHPPRLGL